MEREGWDEKETDEPFDEWNNNQEITYDFDNESGNNQDIECNKVTAPLDFFYGSKDFIKMKCLFGASCPCKADNTDYLKDSDENRDYDHNYQPESYQAKCIHHVS
jgi:hypothetical protein